MGVIAPKTLNQYVGTNSVGLQTTIVAADMTTACEVYYNQETSDPVTMQCTKQNIKCILPAVNVSFTTEVYDTTGTAKTSCTATPEAYVLAAGTQQLFTAKAGEGWSFTKWQIDGEDVAGDEGTKAVALLTIPESTSPVVIRAVFAATASE